MTQEEVQKSLWSWKRFSQDFLQLEANQPQGNIAASLFAAFFIVIIAGQVLGFINTVYNEKMLMEKYKNSSALVYGVIG